MGTLKPIFHCDAATLGTFASANPKDSTFALPNAKNTNMLVSLGLGDASFLRWPCTFLFFVYISFALGSQREPHFLWNIGGVGSSAVGYVYFMYISVFCASFSALATRKLADAKADSSGIWALSFAIFAIFDLKRHLKLLATTF